MPKRLPSAVIADPNVMGGVPVIRGTRVPAQTIVQLIRLGAPVIEILQDYPSLYPEDIEAALRYVGDSPGGSR